MGQDKKQRKSFNFGDFKDFKRKVVRAPINDRAYTRWGYRNGYAVRDDFSLKEIEDIIREGDLEALRQLSLYYYRTNGDYRNNVDFLSVLSLYDTVVIPVMTGKGSQTQIVKSFDNACEFIERLDLPNTLTHITREWIKVGIYYGIMREEGKNVVIQDLPLHYCRTRFKDFNNLNILEFNLQYFESIHDEEYRKELIASFPPVLQKAWRDYFVARKTTDPWVMLPAELGGVCFCFADDQTPLLLASIPELKKMQDAIGREEKRDENELYKLLIQRMPRDSDGELIFELDETAELHASIAAMLADLDTVEVVTSLGEEVKVESLQDSTAASQSNDRIEKYRKNAYNSLGRSSIMFNAENSSTLAYSIKKDEALITSYLNQYETWIKFVLNERFSRNGLSFDFEILPTTVFNRQDLQRIYFSGAQYGYPKMFAGVSMGIKQRDQISLMTFENEFLKMSEKMVPLQSSYTTPGGGENSSSGSGEKTSTRAISSDLDNKGGRPELPDEQKSEKTQANRAAMG